MKKDMGITKEKPEEQAFAAQFGDETVRTLRELSKKQDKNKTVLLPDDIKAGYHNVADLLHFLADMLE